MSLNIIVPVHNVSAYASACFDSLAALDIADTRFIIVNAGSTDDSPRIADEYAATDPRFHVIHAPKISPGEARNLGVEHSESEYIGFLDGDDLVVKKGYEAAFALLNETGSDFVTMPFRRLKPGGKTATSNLCRGHKGPARGIHLHDAPDVLFSTTLWSKIYRRDFWMPKIHPLGATLYEDLLPLVRAFTLASRFDIADETAVLWRIRGDSSSISQKLRETQNLRDRAEVMHQSFDFLKTEDESFTDHFLRRLLGHDIGLILRHLHDATDPVARQEMANLFARMLALIPREAVFPGKTERKALAGMSAFIAECQAGQPPEYHARLIPAEAFRITATHGSETSVSHRGNFSLEPSGTTRLAPADFAALHIHHVDTERREVFWCHPATPITPESATFLYQSLRSTSREGYSVSFDALAPWQEPLALRPVLIFSIGRCGSTLFSKIGTAAGCPIWSEPDGFTNLATRPELREDPALLRRLTRTLLSDLAGKSAATGNPHFGIKFRSQVTPICEEIASHHPDTVSFFLVREPRAWARSFHRLWGFRPRRLALTLAGQVAHIRAARARGFAVSIVNYDQLVAAPEAEIARIHAALRLPGQQAPDIGAILSQDAQGGTAVARDRGKPIPEGFIPRFEQVLRRNCPQLLSADPGEWFA